MAEAPDAGETEALPLFEGQDVYCLLVDDDPLQLALTEELLKQSHVQVVGCTNPHNVLELLRNTVFNAIITDIQMPMLDGYHLLEQIRTSGIPGTDKIPVIALSASIAKEHEHYLEAGFTGFLNKPFTAAQLISLLNELLTLHLEARSELNFSSLTAFAGEDPEASASILKTFSEETRKSIDLLRDALEGKDREEASRISHKLIPLFTMLGANSLVKPLPVAHLHNFTLEIFHSGVGTAVLAALPCVGWSVHVGQKRDFVNPQGVDDDMHMDIAAVVVSVRVGAERLPRGPARQGRRLSSDPRA